MKRHKKFTNLQVQALEILLISIFSTIAMSGGVLLIKQGIKYNTSFSGIYNFNAMMNYSQLFPLFLDSTLNNGLIMCHPGLAHSNFSDPIANNRIAEYEYLVSDEFLADCDLNQIKIISIII